MSAAESASGLSPPLHLNMSSSVLHQGSGNCCIPVLRHRESSSPGLGRARHPCARSVRYMSGRPKHQGSLALQPVESPYGGVELSPVSAGRHLLVKSPQRTAATASASTGQLCRRELPPQERMASIAAFQTLNMRCISCAMKRAASARIVRMFRPVASRGHRHSTRTAAAAVVFGTLCAMPATMLEVQQRVGATPGGDGRRLRPVIVRAR